MATVASEAPYEERPLFVRKATGLVRGWSVHDAFIYATFSINLITLGLYIFSFGPFIPKASLLWAVILSGAYLLFQTVVYASLIAVMPRSQSLSTGRERWKLTTYFQWCVSSIGTCQCAW